MQIFQARVSEMPHAVAVVCEDESLTYDELDHRSSNLAACLAEAGARPDLTVGLLVERCVEMIVGMLAIMKSGAAYLPIDPGTPPERIRFLLADSGTWLLLAQRVLPLPNELPCRKFFFDQAVDTGAFFVPPAVAPENLAYVIYTSGSTGRPKGVAVEQRQLVNYLRAVIERMRPSHPSSFALISTLAADLGHTSIFPALATGATLHVIPSDLIGDGAALGGYMRRHDVECMKIVPSHLRTLLAAAPSGEVLPTKLLILGGESSPPALINEILALAPGCAILNHYGPTETTVGVLTHRVTDGPVEGDTLPLGKPLANVTAYVLDESLLPVGRGIAGEICIGGASVARGYVGAPDLTAERFVPDSNSTTGGRLYRTGDRGRLRADGAIEFLGRVDHQVKIRGFRVELGEIESILQKHPLIIAAAAMLREDVPGDPRLVAYVVAREGFKVSTGDLRAWMSSRVPQQMIPAVFMLMDQLPLSPSGKIDRRALPVAHITRIEALVEPRTSLERLLVALWSEVLGMEKIGIDDNFFALGGHSLIAMLLIGRLRKLRIDLPLRNVFEAPTIRALAAQSTSSRTEKIAMAALRLRSMGSCEARLLLANQPIEVNGVTR
ncbi:MAG: non-ribosomal peptide synthetase [Terracidiphilus sp.]